MGIGSGGTATAIAMLVVMSATACTGAEDPDARGRISSSTSPTTAGPMPSTPESSPTPAPSPPTPSPSASASASGDEYEYCERAVGNDPRCHSTTYGNNLRALDDFLDGVEEWGGVRETTATAQGLTKVPVGTTVDMLLAQIPLALSQVLDTAGMCSAVVDPTAQVGVVALRTPGPRGEVEAVQAILIGNPVVRTSDDLGVGSTLAELRSGIEGLTVERSEDGWVAVSTPEAARESLATQSDRRVMFFRLNSEGRVTEWSLGVPEFALGLCAVA